MCRKYNYRAFTWQKKKNIHHRYIFREYKGIAIRQRNSKYIASTASRRFSFEAETSGNASVDIAPGKSKRKGDKHVKTKKKIHPGTVKKDRRMALPRRRQFLYTIQLLLLRRVGPLALAPLSSEHRKRVPKHAPSRPTSTRLLFQHLSVTFHHNPKMKIGWCSREIRGGRAEATRGRRSSRSHEHPAMCVCVCVARRQFCRMDGWACRLRIIVVPPF